MSASAAIVLQEDFERATQGLNVVPAGWTVTDSDVDVAGPDLDSFRCAGSGNCVDLDGSSFQAGVLQRTVQLHGRARYMLSFGLRGLDKELRVYFLPLRAARFVGGSCAGRSRVGESWVGKNS